LLTEVAEDALTIPLIAARADVTPSTIYRRWNTLAELLAAVLRDEFHGDRDQPNTGNFQADLQLWLGGFVDDMSSGPGRTLLHERVGNAAVARRAAGYAYANLKTLTEQAESRGENVHDANRLMDLLVAPVVYRLVYAGQSIDPAFQADLIATALALPPMPSPLGQPSFSEYVIYPNN
jgi:AcrR family transcriptional regulator